MTWHSMERILVAFTIASVKKGDRGEGGINRELEMRKASSRLDEKAELYILSMVTASYY